MADLVGKQLGAYRILECLGEGGMATVYKGHQPSLNRYVAIKVLSEPLGRNKELVERFLREARAAAQLRHPNIIHIYDMGHEGDWYYIVMDYVDGGSLAGKLKREGALGVGTALSIVRQIGSALDYAHGQGIVHRDVKPSNILLRARGQAILSDFGIARAAAEARLTRTGTLVGTPEYMSPEQADGKEVDGRSDVYSLGVVLYEMLTGRAPFKADTPVAVLYKQVHEAPLPPSRVRGGISAGVEAVVLRALAKDRRQRYQSAGEMVSALSQAEVGAGTRAHSGAAHPTEGATTAPIAGAPNVSQQPVALRSRRNVHLYLMGAVLTALLVLAVLWGGGGGRRASTPLTDTAVSGRSPTAWASATVMPVLAPTSTVVPSRTPMGVAYVSTASPSPTRQVSRLHGAAGETAPQPSEVQLTSFDRGAMDPVLDQMVDGSVWLIGHYQENWQPFYTISYDGGHTWSQPALLWEEASYDLDLAQTQDGGIWAAWVASPGPVYSPHYCTTMDGGQTWSPVTGLSVPPDYDTVMSIVPVSSSETWLCWEGGCVGSTDGGQRWGDVRAAPDFGGNNATFGHTRDGRRWVSTVSNGAVVQVQWSDDGGETWSSSLMVANIELAPDGLREPIRPVARLLEDGRGELWLAWYAYSSETNSSQVWFARSVDGGATWSSPTQATDDPSFHGSYFSNVSIAEVDGSIWLLYASDKSGKWQVYRQIVGGLQSMSTRRGTRTATLTPWHVPMLAKVRELRWALAGRQPEMARLSTAMAYDRNRQVMVMFGGRDRDDLPLSDTWEYDGIRWLLISADRHPCPRYWHSMVFDIHRKRIVLFGGVGDGTVFDDTWEYDGADWRSITTAHSPPGRKAASMVYDSCRRRVILFGGDANRLLADTWEYDGSDWRQIQTTGSPEPRSLAGIAFDSARCRAVLFGGYAGFGDTWEYDGAQWKSVTAAASPLARWAHAMAYDDELSGVVLLGGYGPTYPEGAQLADTWMYDGTNWMEMPLSGGPTAREQHAMDYDFARSRMVVFGGHTSRGGVESDTWECELGGPEL